MPLKTNEREYRNLALLEPAETNKRFDTDFYVEGHATTFDKPYELYEFDGVKYYEMIARDALADADMSDIILQYNHQGKVLARTANGTLAVEPGDTLFMAADLSKSAAAKELHEEIRNGLVTRMSWAFTVAEDAYDRETRTRTILRVKKVYDVSAVSIPASQDTGISARSFVDGEIEKEQQELLERNRRLELARAKYFYMGGN
jgi:HK97 family phage prohead protease